MSFPEIRIGVGYDIHRLAQGRPLILGGIKIPFNKGFVGHSDGDCLSHAIADALFGAVALGDIGRHFPDTDPRFKGADSAVLLGQVVDMIFEKGFCVSNVDANIIAEAPKMAPHINDIRKKVASILKVDVDCISIKARTNEGLDSIGRGKAIAVQVVLMVARRTK